MSKTSMKFCVPLLALLLNANGESLASSHLPYLQVVQKDQQLIDIRLTVVDKSPGEPIEGVSIMVGNRQIGSTNASGVFQKEVIKGTEISFKRIGYAQSSIKANKNNIRVELSPLDESIDEVVVTALGIKRDEKALGYSTTTVKGEQLTEALSSNWMDALSGKVAGLNLMRSNAGPVGTTKIILRGENNITGENEALIIVDGVMVNGGSGRRSALDSDNAYGVSSENMPVDYGSGMDDINPEDIETITVLKGPGAAALYGQRAANGAIVITTKSGSKKDKGIGVTVNSNVSFESMNRSPALQYEYGQGLGGSAHYSYGPSEDGHSTAGTSSAYGPKFDGQKFFQYDPKTQTVGLERTPWRAYSGKNGVNAFFDVGRTYTNSVSIDGSTDKTTARFSATNVQNKWIVPNTGYKRNTFAISVNSKVSDKLQINTKVNYNNRWSDNLPGSGYGNQSLMYWYIFWQPSSDINGLKDYWVKGKENERIKYPFSSYPENPYAIVNEFINSNNRHVITGNAQTTYQFTKELSLLLRASMDLSTENRFQNRPYDAGSRLPEGSHRTQAIFGKETNADFLLRYQKEINKDFDFSITAGGATLANEYRRDELASDGLTFPGEFNHSNSKYGVRSKQRIEKFETNSFYGLMTAAYREFLFLDATARMDWTSTLHSSAFPDKKVNFFYPSLNGSFVISEIANLPEIISFAKIRASIAETGSGAQTPYLTNFTYQVGNPLIGGSLTNPHLLVNPLLKPLKTNSLEFGADIRLFKNKVNLDVSVYKANSFNQHLRRIVDASSGVNRFIMNVGEVQNTGLEIALNTNQIKNANFSWSSLVTYTANRNKILELSDSSIVIQARSIGLGQIIGHVGGSMGDMFGLGYLRAPDGQIIYDERTGYAKLTNYLIPLGNNYPKGKLSFGNTFNY